MIVTVSAQPDATPVAIDIVRREPMTQTMPLIGRLVAVQSGIVAARTAGPVASVAVDVGDRVARDAVLATLDQARLTARLELVKAEQSELQARLALTEANEQLARQELGRITKLRGSAAFNQALYDTEVQQLAAARSSRREAQARIARGEVALQLAEIELHDSQIRAPFSGTVIARHVTEGTWVQTGDPIVTLLNDRKLEIEAMVPAERLGGLTANIEISVALVDGSRHKALLRAVIPDENPAARTRPVRFVPVFGILSSRLANNQAVTVYIPTGAASDMVAVNKDAVLRRGEQALVFVVENGVARSRPVRLGMAVGNRFQVLEGLAPGEWVVIRGNERLQPGQNVRYPEPGPTPQRETTHESDS